ncbi:hypothetical protein, partial [Anaerobutyricum hallii]|uniref:hypothetical protein n=1 Tax=Anaerobutyricum hallii TaxID=39488 RepID=UPI001A9A5A55
KNGKKIKRKTFFICYRISYTLSFSLLSSSTYSPGTDKKRRNRYYSSLKTNRTTWRRKVP